MSNPTDTSSDKFQVRRQTKSQRPEDRGELIKEFETWKDAVAFIKSQKSKNLFIYRVTNSTSHRHPRRGGVRQGERR